MIVKLTFMLPEDKVYTKRKPDKKLRLIDDPSLPYSLEYM